MADVIETLRATYRDLPKFNQDGDRRRKGFSIMTQPQRLNSTSAMLAVGLRLVKCRRCGGTGTFIMANGVDGGCAGHSRLGICFDGRSLGPVERETFMQRQREDHLKVAIAHWRQLVAIVPQTRGEGHLLLMALETALSHGKSVRAYCQAT